MTMNFNYKGLSCNNLQISYSVEQYRSENNSQEGKENISCLTFILPLTV